MDEPQLGTYATYIYIVLMLMSVSIIIFYWLLTIQTYSVTITTPSLSTFEQLQQTYSGKLTWPCSQLAVSHNKMFTGSDPTYHQVK